MALINLHSIFLIVFMMANVEGHGRLIEPPGRSSMWRFGFDTPKNYNDNQLFCGGKWVQWGQNAGKCGVCGDNWAGPKENEPGGKYYTGIIVKKYDIGAVIDVSVHLTANHKGWFEFRLCQNDMVNKTVTQSCFDQHLLKGETGATQFPINLGMEMVKVKLQLPAGVTCSACVLQWKYNCGNSWGTDFETKKGCMGCGQQEQFYGCSDIAIGKPSVKTGMTSPDVEVPAGDFDERLWRTFNDTCACNCPQVSMANGNDVSSLVFLLTTLTGLWGSFK
ncbi:hypothetical protein MAR_005730 [Mya arenaria]|uniref:Chitin-binding type-4 domain-containing protein n=1 Tax=Mya arenaria TaxID=6604 RepID=A0ABY7F1T1_MYAAR|nr:uncharacterized protein LOC128245714 [Mya arenaria]WAR15625.1 hypothetical protein MAR_005730 [Mya arenaria]